MGEIISIVLGKCGNQMGTKSLETIAAEHGLDSKGRYVGDAREQLDRINVFFRKSGDDRYFPRALLVDLEPGVIEAVKSGDWGGFYDGSNVVFAQSSAQNNWAKGRYSEGEELRSSVMHRLRLETERAENLQGFVLFHSLGGGTGSGMGSLLIEKIREEFPDKLIATCSMWPSSEESNGKMGYNAVLGARTLAEQADLSFIFNFDSLQDVCTNAFQIRSPTLLDYNHLIAGAMSNATAPLRFAPGESEFSTLRDMAVALAPFPRLHFVTVGLTPLTRRGTAPPPAPSAADLAKGLFAVPNTMAADLKRGKILAAHAVFRGRMTRTEIDSAMRTSLGNLKANLADWLPNAVRWGRYGDGAKGAPTSAALLANSTAQKDLFQKALDQFSAMFNRRANLGAYTSEGMSESEFGEARDGLNALISDCQQYQDATATS